MSQKVVQLVAQLRKKNIHVKLSGEKLKINAPPGALNDEIKAELKENKEALMAFLKSALVGDESAIACVARKQPFPQSFPQSLAQERLWVMHQLQLDASYNMAHALRIEGPLQAGLLQQAFQAVVGRHESLRTSFATEKGGEPVQVIIEQADFELPCVDLSAVDQGQQQTDALDLAQQEAQKAFDLHHAPLLRAKLLKLAGDKHILFFTLHHIISDGWSLGVLVREVMQNYGALKERRALPLPDLPIQYVDFSQWQRQRLAGEMGQARVAYWKKALAGVPDLLDLPTDKNRPEQQTFQGAAHHFSFGARETVALKHCAQAHDVTLFMLLLAGFQVLLGRLAQQDDVCVGVPVSGRENIQTHGLIGFFINALVLRGDMRGNPTVAEYLQRVRTSTLGAFEHQDVPMEEVLRHLPLRRDAAFNPGAQVGFSWQAGLGQALPENALEAVAELSVAPFDVPQTNTIQDLTLSLWEGEKGIEGRLEYATDLFEPDTIKGWAEHYRHLLGVFTQQATQSICNIEIFSQDTLIQHLGVDDYDIEVILPLTPMQRDIYLDALINPGSLQNSMAYAVPLQGAVDISRWQRALDALVATEPALRTEYKCTGSMLGDRLYQVVKKHGHHDLHILDWRKDELDDDALKLRLNDLLIRPYDIHHDALFRHALILVSEQDYVLTGATHHINSDGVGMSAHVRKWLTHYTAQTTDGVRIPQSEESFQQHVAEIRAKTDKLNTLNFWREEFKDVEPLVFALPSQKGDVTASKQFVKHCAMDKQHSDQVQTFCRKQGIVPALYFKVLYGYLIKQYCRPSADFDITEFNAGRNEANKYDIGIYYCQQPFIFTQESLGGGKHFIDLIAFARDFQKTSKSHRFISISQKLRLSQPGPMGFTYNYYHFERSGKFEGKYVEAQLLPPVMEQSVQLVVSKDASGFHLSLNYNSQTFMDFEFLRRLACLSEQLVKTPEIKLREFELLLPHERDLFFNMNALAQRSLSSGSRESTTSVHALIESQVEKTPSAIAVRFNDQALTYQELNNKANQLSIYLKENGVGRNAIVAICLPRSLDMMVALLAALKAGAAYLPLDPGYPEERLSFILRDSKASALLVSDADVENISAARDTYAGTCINLDEKAASLKHYPTGNPQNKNGIDDPIYVIYTSGSTGQPKGVVLKHRGELNLLNWYVREFELNPASRVMMLSAFGFDLTQKNLLAPLVCGAQLILPDGNLIDASYLVKQISAQQVTLVNCAPSVFYPLLEECEACEENAYETLGSLRQVIFGGESIQINRLLGWLGHENCHTQIINNYGPTECTDIAAYYRVNKEDIVSGKPIPIGRANDNVALYLVNDEQQLLPQGLIGELCISGEGVGAGYLHRPALTREVFEANPYCDEVNRVNVKNIDIIYPEGQLRWYHSGDLMRYLPDGNLEFVGRKDFQVKVRGLRIEPGEIEWALTQASRVEAALVLAKEDRLLAFVLEKKEVDTDQYGEWDWRKHLRAYLPDAMLPSALCRLEKWPLTPNGKIDRNVLPQLATGESNRYVPPRNAIEQALCEMWQQILGLDKVGVEDNFFEIGGHSLLATRIISRCRQRFQVDVPLKLLFDSPTIETLALLITQNENKQCAPLIEPAPANTPIPLSFAQQRLWFIEQLNPGNVAYLIPGAFKISGTLNMECFIGALKDVVNRHEVLRTHIHTRDGEGWQVVDEASQWQPQWIDLSDEGNQQEAIAALIKRNSNTALNLETDPLFNVTLAKLSNTETLLVSCMHHIVGDGWSFGILLQELAHYYGVRSAIELGNKATGLPALSVQYGDYALWQRNWIQGDVLAAHLDFWQQHLSGAPAVLNLPFDRPRPKVQSFEGSNFSFTLEPALSEKLKHCAGENQLTLFMLLLGAYNIQLSRYSGQKDICVGLPVAGRDHAPTEQLIGLFLNAIVLRTRFEGNATLADYFQGIKASLLACLAHQNLPAEILLEQLNIERDISHAPVAQVGFQLQNFEDAGVLPAFSGLELEALPLGRVSSKYDMTFILREGEQGIAGVVEYSTALFDEASIAQFVAHYITLLEHITASFEQRVHDVGLVSAQQLRIEVGQSNAAVTVNKLSHMQRDLVLLSRVNPDTLDNCFGGALVFPEKVDEALLYQALEKVAENSSILRSRISLVDTPWLDDAYQVVYPGLQVQWQSRSDVALGSAKQIDHYVRHFVFRPYDLADKLLRFELLHHNNTSILVIGVHHALMDGMGVASMVATLLEVYHALSVSQDLSLPAEYFPRYLKKEREQTDTPSAIAYWRERLSNTSGLSQWRAKPLVDAQKQGGDRSMTRQLVTLDDAHWAAVKKYCRKKRITPALYFKALYGLLVKLYCRPEDDFSIFELSADLLGMKLNAAGCSVQRRPFIFELASMQAGIKLDAYFKGLRDEQRAINKSGMHTSIMMQQTLVPESRLSFMYNYYHFTRELEVAGHHYDTYLYHNNVEQIHLVVNLKQSQLNLGLHYPEGAFEGLQFVERMAFLSQQIVESTATKGIESLSDFDFTLKDEKSFIQHHLWGEKSPLDSLPRVASLVELSYKINAKNIAFKQDGRAFLYDELSQRVAPICARLLEQGIGLGSYVAICLERSVDLIAALLAVVKTGASYIPIDKTYPQARIAYIINDSAAAVVITSREIKQGLPQFTAECLCVDGSISAESPSATSAVATDLDDIFYLIYTSGSTGQPKGAMVKQQGVSNLLDWYINEFQFDASTQHLVISAFGFDLTQKNLWASLMTGGCIHFPADEHYHPQHLLAQIEGEQITTINCAPSAFYGIVDACEGNYGALASLRWVILGGETIVLEHLRAWLSSEACGAQLVNNYGPTECTDIAAFYRLENLQRQTVPIGGPNTNVDLHLINEAGQPVPPGLVGELCISGAGVGAGYLNKPELSESAFQALAYDQEKRVAYHSGDLMCLLPSGDLEFVGRKDFQVKLRGLRIELQEIEQALLSHDGVEDCLVQIDRRAMTETVAKAGELERLVAYVCGPDSLKEINWRLRLSECLPQYMVPYRVMVLNAWPLTPNGKIDRSALPKIEEGDATPFVAPRDDIETTLAQIWCEVLGLARVGVWDNFFQIGGNSLLAVRIMARMEKRFDTDLSLSMLFTAQNVAELAQLVARQVNPESWSPLVLIKEAKLAQGEAPLPPLYLIHPVGGTLLCYHALVEALSQREPKRAVYGLQCSGLEPNQAVLNRFEIMAGYYIEAIKLREKQSEQSPGPYYLVGQSLGGNIAWEMAQQLKAQHREVAFVGLIDTFVPDKIPLHFRQQTSLSLLKEQMGRSLDLDWDALKHVSLQQQIERFYYAAQEKGLVSAELSLDQVQRIAHVMKANTEALLAYQAQACSVPVVHVGASENKNGDSSVGWDELATELYLSYSLTASHDGILQGACAAQLAELLDLSRI